jgi:hypothetical protein
MAHCEVHRRRAGGGGGERRAIDDHEHVHLRDAA